MINLSSAATRPTRLFRRALSGRTLPALAAGIGLGLAVMVLAGCGGASAGSSFGTAANGPLSQGQSAVVSVVKQFQLRVVDILHVADWRAALPRQGAAGDPPGEGHSGDCGHDPGLDRRHRRQVHDDGTTIHRRRRRRLCRHAAGLGPGDALPSSGAIPAGLPRATRRDTAELQETVQDVTNDYVDTQAHIANLQTERQRLLDLLGKANCLSDILALDQQLTTVEGELQQIEAHQQALAGEVTYYTVTLTLQPTDLPTSTQTQSGFDLWRHAARRLGRSARLRRLAGGLGDLVSDL